jgi:hypothetical protein
MAHGYSESDRKERKPYEPPKIDTYSGAEILSALGPAIAVYGGLPGGP